MATVNVTQYQYLAGDQGGKLGQAGMHDGNETASDVTVNTAGNLTVTGKTRYLMINPDADIYYRVGTAATSGSSTKVNSGVMLTIGIKPGATIYFDDGTFA